MAVLEVNHLSKTFGRGKHRFAAVHDVSFQVEEGECFGLVGESGCGKSTTALLLAQLLPKSGGTILFDGAPLPPKPMGRNIQMIFQDPFSSFDPRDTVLCGIMQGAQHFGLFSKRQLEEEARTLCAYVGLKESDLHKKTRALSGGECQRVAIARALMSRPRLLICDEATSALDVLVQAQIVQLLSRLKREQNTSFLFITHDLPLAAILCDRIGVMDQGALVECVAAKEILFSPKHPQTNRLVEAAHGFQLERPHS